MYILPVVIITTPQSKRVEPLLDRLKGDTRFVVTQIDATMGENMLGPTEISLKSEYRNYGRSLSQSERACAVSHQCARAIISQSDFGGIIFEDDARIIDLDRLYYFSLHFLQKKSKQPRILSLVSYITRDPKSPPGSLQKFYYPLFSDAPLAVATAMTPKAAVELVSGSKKGSMVADWPHSRCKFYVLREGVVNHGDSETSSIIGDADSRIVQMKFSLSSPYAINRIPTRIFQKLDKYLIELIQNVK
jgi:hypothetical protein